MTTTEFQAWREYHGARFPIWSSWLKNLNRADASAAQGDVLAAMYETLGNVTLVDAREASKRLAIGDEPEIESLDSHARRVREVAKKIRGERTQEINARMRVVDGEPTYECPKCQDVGIRTVFQADTVRAARRTPELLMSRKLHAYTMAVSCVCHRGCVFKTNGMLQITDWMIELPDATNYETKLSDLCATAAERRGQTPVYDFT